MTRTLLCVPMLLALCAPIACAQDKKPKPTPPAEKPALTHGVKPSKWAILTAKKGIGAILTLPLPAGLIERGLVVLENQGMSGEDTRLIRKLAAAAPAGWGVSVGCMYKHARDEGGKAVLKAKPAVQPRLSGATRSGERGKTPIFELRVVHVKSTLEDGSKGMRYKTRVQLVSRAKVACEFQLVVSLTRLKNDDDTKTICDGEWTGPFPSTPPKTKPPKAPKDPTKKTGKTEKKTGKPGKKTGKTGKKSR
jgi:hypothetical protein